MRRWSNPFVSASVLALLAGCHSAPSKPARPAPAPAESSASAPVATGVGRAPAANAAAGGNSSVVPPRATQQYAQALALMRSGHNTDAELEFKSMVAGYPQLAGPHLNLGLIYLHDARLPEAEGSFKTALQLNPNSAVAGNELGIVERRMGKFAEAEAAYERTITAEPNYAPAHLNLGVLYDLYLVEPQKALDEYQRYLDLSGDNKQVAGWMIELRKRSGIAAPAPAAPALSKDPV